jgi:hypothetical protein
VRCLAFALASLAIATEHCPTRAPSSPRGRLPQSRRRRPGRTARHRGRPDRLAADPVFTPATASRQQPGALTTPRPARSADVLPRPSPWHHWPAIATEHCPTRAPSSPRGRLPQSRRRRPGRTARHRGRPDRLTADPVFTPATAACQQPGALTTRRPARPAADALPHVPPGTTGRRSPPSTARRGRRHRLVAGFPNREDEDPDATARHRGRPDRLTADPVFTPATAACQQPGALTTPQPRRTGCPMRCLAVRTWHHWPADRHRALPDAGAVVASWQASPIERTKPRTNCPTNCTPLTTATPVCRRASNARL